MERKKQEEIIQNKLKEEMERKREKEVEKNYFPLFFFNYLTYTIFEFILRTAW
jgi:hypothetical protein